MAIKKLDNASLLKCQSKLHERAKENFYHIKKLAPEQSVHLWHVKAEDIMQTMFVVD